MTEYVLVDGIARVRCDGCGAPGVERSKVTPNLATKLAPGWEWIGANGMGLIALVFCPECVDKIGEHAGEILKLVKTRWASWSMLASIAGKKLGIEVPD